MVFFKKTILLAMAVAMSFTAVAQSPVAEQNPEGVKGNSIIINPWYQDWEVSLRLGTQAYLSEYIKNVDFADMWSFPAIDVNVSKWVIPLIGVDLGFSFSTMKNIYRPGRDKYATFAKPDDRIYKTDYRIARGSTGNAYVGFLFDLNNLFGGYKKDRIYNLIASVGGGFMFPVSHTDYKFENPSFNAGLINRFNVTENLCVELALRGTIHDDNFNGISYFSTGNHYNSSFEGTFGVTAGVSYRFDFKKRTQKAGNKTGWSTLDDVVPYTDAYREAKRVAVESTDKVEATQQALASGNEAYKELERKLKDAEARADELQRALDVAKKDVNDYMQIVNFSINRWNVSSREKVNVLYAANIIKAHPELKFNVQGYADKQTATPKYNQFLSEQRAKSVADMLVKDFGVNPDQLTVAGCGGVDYMFFDDAQCSRSVIISVVE